MRGVVVVHGVGQHKRGEFLAEVAEGLADSLEFSPEGNARPTVRREMDISSHPATATLHITAPDGRQMAWYFREAHWQDALLAPAARTVYGWFLRQGWGLVANEWRQLRDLSNSRAYGAGDPPYTPGFGTNLLYLIDFAVFALLRLLLFLIVLPVLLVALEFIYYARFVPGFNPFGWLDALQKLIHKLDPLLSESLGDAQRYLEHGAWAASVRGVVERVLIDMLRNDAVENITVIAHSLGCVVSYEAMARDGAVAQEIRRLRGQGKPDKKITFVTLGSGINQLFAASQRERRHSVPRFPHPLAREIIGDAALTVDQARARFYWLDIVSRLDPVPVGQVLDDRWRQASGIKEEQIKRRKVVNLDSPFRDHSFYFLNRDLVLPRIARAINGGTDYPWPSSGITVEKRRHHTSRVSLLTIMRLAMMVMIIGQLALTLAWPWYRNEPVAWMETKIIGDDSARVVYCYITNGNLHSAAYLGALSSSMTQPQTPKQRVEAKELRERAEDCLVQGNILNLDASGILVAGILALFLFWGYGSVQRRLFPGLF